MKKEQLISMLFEDHMFPAYLHRITAEKIPYDNRWGRIIKIPAEEGEDMHASFQDNPRRLSKEEDEKLLIPGLYNIDKKGFTPRRFKIT